MGVTGEGLRALAGDCSEEEAKRHGWLEVEEEGGGGAGDRNGGGDAGNGSGSEGESGGSRGCLNLEELDVKRCVNLNDRGFIALAARCLHLRQVRGDGRATVGVNQALLVDMQ